MNTQSYNCTRKDLPVDAPDFNGLNEIGDFSWSRNDAGEVDGILINAPEVGGGSRGVVHVPCKQGPNTPGRHWGWDGNLDQPTFTPSIHWIGHWHGYLTAGRLVSC